MRYQFFPVRFVPCLMAILILPGWIWAKPPAKLPAKPATKAAAQTAPSASPAVDSQAAAPGLASPAAPLSSRAAPDSQSAVPERPRILLDYVSLERQAQQTHPILLEKKLNIAKSEQKLEELDRSAILPKFQVETGVGPAPGLKSVLDTTSLLILPNAQFPDTQRVRQFRKDYDFAHWGPFYGIEVNIAQPLNISRYRAGRRASINQIKVSEAEFQKEKMDVSEETQKLYFSRVYAGMMLSILQEAGRELDRAQKRMQNMLDEGDKNVNQTDLLEIKAGRYALEKSRNEANLGVARADLGLRFLIQAPDSVALFPRDTILSLRPETLPSLDSLKMLTLYHHPDLKRLANGLAARQELIRVAKGEVGPDIFLFGNFRYTKAWSSDRQSGGDDPFARDPLNELTGVGGLGIRLNLNFWQRYEKVRKERIELKQLQRTESYAAGGLLLKVQDEYVQLLKARANVTESQKSLRAAEAWLKAAAMKYDLDPGNAKDLISPYKTVLFAKRDYFEAVLDYNLAVSKVIKSMGWTLSDFFHNLSKGPG